MLSSKHILSVGAGLAGLAVALGAFGAHALKGILTVEEMVTFQTSNRYHMYHALALLIAGWGAREFNHSLFRRGAWCFIIGMGLFSGSLYILVFSGANWLGMFTPLGGVFLLSGWICLLLGFWRSP